MPTSKNFIVSPAVTIRQIRENLREGRYSQAEGIFGIIKELVQNAEDAKAGQLLIAWTAELPGASHPLLQGPGLLAVNDGHFRAEDGRAIRRFGLNSKAADAASIGKFGLGLKSVFHLAEVFFFTAVNERGKVLDADVLNPWSDEAGGLHPDWDDWPAADQDRMQSFVRSFGSGGRRFCLWIPLRRRGRLGAVEPITRNFPGDLAVNSLFAGDMPGRLARLLPMLRHLREISVWVVSPDGPTRSFLVKVGDDSSRRTDMKELERLQANSPRSFAGQAIVTGTASDQRFVYSGRELRYDDPGLHALENAEFWPQDIAMDEETGEEVHVREKARPHAAVCFAATRTSSANPRLAVNWSMFLPLSEPAVISLAQSGWSVDVFLHGYFFVDAGRNQIEGINAAFPGSIQDSSGLRRAWNQGLARRGTLPLLPLAMSDVTDKAGWDDDMVANLTRQLAASSLFQEYAPDICRDWIWLRRLTPDATSRWQIAPASQPLHVLPGAAGDRSLAFAVFPSLQQATADTLIGFRDDPRLTAKPLEPWPDDLVTRLLESAVPEAVFASRDCIQYLSRFLEQCDRSDPRTEARQSRGAKTAHLLRRGLSALGRPIPVTLAGPLGEFVRRIPPAHRVCFKPSQIDSNRELFAWLCDQEVDIAWIPEELEPTDSPSAGRIGVDQCTRILEGLANWGQREQGSEEREARAEVAAQLHRACNDTNGLMSRCGNLKLFTGRNCRLGREVLLSWKEIAEHQQRQTLFTKPSPLAKQLQDGLADDTILLVTKELYLLLFGGDKAPACREAQLLATLASQPRPRLAPPEHRRQLLTTLLRYQGGRDDPQYARCVRYLLHGQVQHFETTTPLLVRPEHRDIWSRMAEVALARLDQAWCLLDASFAGALRGDEYGEFGVTVVDHDVAIARALPVDPAQFACLEPNESEYRLLLRHIEDTEFTSRLPIHQDCAGRFVGIDAHSFWESGLSLPAVLENKVRILRRSRDEATWKRQQQLAPVLDEMVVLDIVLQEPSPGKCWQVILDCLVAIDHVPLTLVTRLRSAAWLPTTSETFVKPEDVIHLPEFSDDVSRLSADYQGVFVDPARLNPQVREPSTFRRLAALAFPARDEALAMLGTLLVDDDRNRVGDVVDVSLDDWLDAFRGAPAELCPAYDLLRRLKERFATAAASTFAELCRPFSEQRGRELLDFLRDAHEKERGVMRKQKIAKVFAQYLRTRVTRERFCEQLSGENLLAADGSWRPAEALCCSNDGVARQAVLDPLLEQALANRFPESVAKGGTSAADLATRGGRSQEPKREDVERAIQATAERLREYFDPWRDVIPNEQIGGFLALLGDDPGVRQLAQSFLGHNRALEETRANFEMPELCSGTYIEDRVVVQLVREATVRVLNLFGQPIEVPRDERPSTLFVGYGARADQFARKIVDRLRICAFRLNVINPRHFAEAELSRLLRDSAIKFMSASYGRDYQQTRFAATWEELSASDQLDIAITQSRIVEHGFLILDKYGL